MPQIELTLPEGALDVATQDRLMNELTTTLLRIEGAPADSSAALAISWGYVNEVPVVSVPEDALDDERKNELVREVTRLVLGAEGTDDPTAAFRVWVMINEVPDGNWGGAGRIWKLRELAKLVNVGADDVDAGVRAVAGA
jgi:phenylpyruvate tautomerase PptA (4-oxalocrotonate tautomerase family)